tara:strand:- start:1434 stop:1673 length:240 start_codon:yes stop_codon:yes gene_type:complete
MINNNLVIIETDFGVVGLSKGTVRHLNRIDNEWDDILLNKRRQKGKRFKAVKVEMNKIEQAVFLMAKIKFDNNEDFEYF